MAGDRWLTGPLDPEIAKSITVDPDSELGRAIVAADTIHPNEEEAVGDWLAFRYANPHVQRWEDLPTEYVVHWLREARELLTYVDQFRKVRAEEIKRRS